MQKIMEVYDLKADKAEQLAGVHRTWRVPAETPMTAAEIEALGYFGPRLLPTGEWAALHRFLFTTDLIVGIDRFGYRTRFGYESAFDALNALTQWGGTGDPSGPWIKEKGQGRDRENPNAHKLHS